VTEVLAHPLVIGLVLFLAAQITAAVITGVKMWARLGHVESTTGRIDRVVEMVRADVVEAKTVQATLTAELRAHMAEEERSITRLEKVIRSTMERQ